MLNVIFGRGMKCDLAPIPAQHFGQSGERLRGKSFAKSCGLDDRVREECSREFVIARDRSGVKAEASTFAEVHDVGFFEDGSQGAGLRTDDAGT